MGFSCEVFQKTKKLKEEYASYKFYGIAPNNEGSTDAPNRLLDIHGFVASYPYKDKFAQAASDCFSGVQAMAKENLESLKQPHCSTCGCETDPPVGWSVHEIEKLLAIDASTITKICGGY